MPRAADNELLAALLRGELCYVLNARQMGKSSLCVRTRKALEGAGVRTAFLDLQKFGSSATAEQWYRALLERLGYDLKLRNPFLAHWRDNAELPPLTRLFNALREVALEQIEGNIVVFLDEIDVVRDLDFKTDEFFAAIRACLNARTDDPAYNRLTFCVIGTVAPTDLIKDVRLSPFNVGTRIRLADFTPDEAALLGRWLPGGQTTLERNYRWTSGHPYLTQRLCDELWRTQDFDVDGMVKRLFFARSDMEVDENVKNVRNTILRMGGEEAGFDRTDLLLRYGEVESGKSVIDDDTDPICTALRLAGLVTTVRGHLRPRCRIYQQIFDAEWVRSNLPNYELRRQREAERKARWQANRFAAIAIVMGITSTILMSCGYNLISTQKSQLQNSHREIIKNRQELENYKSLLSTLDKLVIDHFNNRSEIKEDIIIDIAKRNNLKYLNLNNKRIYDLETMYGDYSGKGRYISLKDINEHKYKFVDRNYNLRLIGYRRYLGESFLELWEYDLYDYINSLHPISRSEKLSIYSQISNISKNILLKNTESTPSAIAPQKALQLARMAVEFCDGTDGVALDTLAAAHFACGDLAAALQAEREAVRLSPGDRELKANLARYEKLAAEKGIR